MSAVCGVKEGDKTYGCGQDFAKECEENKAHSVLKIMGPHWDIPYAFFHAKCKEDATRYVEDSNAWLEKK